MQLLSISFALWLLHLVHSGAFRITKSYAQRTRWHTSESRTTFGALATPDPKTEADESSIYSLPDNIQNANKLLVETVKDILGLIYGDRHYARFSALETIARVPYFSYTSVLHLYETLGWFRRKEYIKLHFAETWNELHHLLIMEALGGSERFADRWVAQHIAFFYYWFVVVLYITAPAVAYDMMSKIEAHAFNTYDEFLKSHEEELKSLPAPQVAIDYYEKDNLFLFDAFQNNVFDAEMKGLPVITAEESRRPVIDSLYDVFFNIRADEGEHSATMARLQRDVCERKSKGESPL